MQNVPVVLFVGLIGSGKSTVLKILKEKGVAIILTDSLWNQQIYQECHRGRLFSVFGEDVLNGDGTPNRVRLRSLIFSMDKEKQPECLQRIHDLFLEFGDTFRVILQKEIQSCRETLGVTMIVIESASALASGWDKKIEPDHIVALHCDESVRLHRLSLRDSSIDKVTYLAIMSMQSSPEDYRALSIATNAIRVDSDCTMDDLAIRSADLYEKLTARE